MKRFWLIFFFVLLALGATFFSGISYLLHIGKGEWKLLHNSRPLVEVMTDLSVPDSIKQQLRYIREVKKFAEDSLGLKHSENYSTYYDQHGKPVVWIVMASPRYALQPYTWSFPVAGRVPYKGFFDESLARAQEEILKEQGYDTHVGITGGFSTLGWFTDPVLSGMLSYSPGRLAELIIHELTHGTVYRPDSSDFNENFASFAGEEGALRFVRFHFGAGSEAERTYRAKLHDDKLFEQHIVVGAARLKTLYATFSASAGEQEKAIAKDSLIKKILSEAESLPFADTMRSDRIHNNTHTINNVFFLDYLTYDARKDMFREVLERTYDGDLRKYIQKAAVGN